MNKDWHPNVLNHHQQHHPSPHLPSNGINSFDNLRSLHLDYKWNYYWWNNLCLNDREHTLKNFFRTIPSFMRIQDNPLPPAPPHPGYMNILSYLTFLSGVYKYLDCLICFLCHTFPRKYPSISKISINIYHFLNLSPSALYVSVALTSKCFPIG